MALVGVLLLGGIAYLAMTLLANSDDAVEITEVPVKKETAKTPVKKDDAKIKVFNSTSQCTMKRASP